MEEVKIGLTADFLDEQGNLTYQDIGLSVLDGHPKIVTSFLNVHQPTVEADQVSGLNGLIVLTPKITRGTLQNADDFLAVGRFGVGYDTVDVAACTDADVVLFITPGTVDRPVAEATLGWMIALSHNVMSKHRLVKEGKWTDRSQYMGSELRDRTLGLIGAGGIARELLRLLGTFGMNQPIAYDPFLPKEQANQIGIKLVDLDELMTTADLVSIHCPLTEQTRGLIGEKEIGLMKPTAYLLNTARGGIVDEEALFKALESRKIAGAALDCFENEPITEPHRFGVLENVILAPHSIAWTNELFRDIGLAACQGMVQLFNGEVPKGVVNREVFDKPSFQEKWKRLADL